MIDGFLFAMFTLRCNERPFEAMMHPQSDGLHLDLYAPKLHISQITTGPNVAAKLVKFMFSLNSFFDQFLNESCGSSMTSLHIILTIENPDMTIMVKFLQPHESQIPNMAGSTGLIFDQP